MIEDIRNPQTRDIDSHIDCEIFMNGEWLPHTTRPEDDATADRYHELKNGDYGEVDIIDDPESEEIDL